MRECLAVCEKSLPDDWRMFDARSVLGGCLVDQKKCDEAEPLLISGYEGMKQREGSIPADSKRCLKEAPHRLVQLHEAAGQPEKAAEWQKRLEELNQSVPEAKSSGQRKDQ
jgi:hypothetical protein